jgi:hypothetical protein
MARRVWLLPAVLLTVCTVLEAQILPAGPSKFVDTTYPVMAGATINVPAGGDFQAALNQAQLGDTIVLQAGATYSGSFTLNPKSGSGWILIRTSAADSSLPAQGRRITPSYASVLPKIVATSSAPAIQVARSAHHYRFVGLEITVASSVSLNYGLVALGDDSTSTSSQIPTNLVLDRVYIHGLPNNNLRRGVAMNSATSAVIDSYISDVHEAGADSQAICGWNGPGPFKISNDYLEAAGENVLFGGADPAVTNLVPSDIEIRGNYFFKPVSWQSASWTVKNILELKNAQRVIADGNIFEHNWPAAQNGFSILFTVRNQDGSAPWSVVQDVTFTHNIVRHVAAAVNILGTDDIHPSQQTKRVLIANNLFADVSGVNWGGSGRLFQILDGVANLTIDHNTAFQTGEVIAAAGPADTAFTYRNNLSPNNQYGVAGDNYYGNPLGALSTYFPGAVFLKNILQGGDPSKYPPNNFFPATMNDVGFVNFSGGDYHLAASSAYKNAGTDGRDVGADIDSVNSATAGAISGNAGSPPPPPPPDTTPPSVSITAPANGATVSTTVTVSANASDNVGVAGVQFYVDGATLGAEDTAGPYSVSWDTTSVANGSHSLTAIARDAAGNRTTSVAVTVTVSNTTPDTTPPSVSITAPANGATVSTTVTVSANASDNVGVAGVQFYVDGATLGVEDTAGPYSVSWDTTSVANGSHSLTAIARDAAGNRTTSAAVTVTVSNTTPDTTPPTVAITAPANGATVSTTATVSANASDNVGVAGVQFYVDGATLGAEDTVSPFTISWDTTRVANGAHTLTAVARDAAGNRTTSAAVSVTVSNATAGRSPYYGTPFQIPGTFQAEDFDKGGEGVAYHDNTAGNQGGLYRTSEDVDIISPYAGGYVVNNFETGEWMEYTINVAASGTYKIEALVSSMFSNSQFHVSIDGVDKTGLVNGPNTGLWTTFQWVGKSGITLAAGQHILRLTADVQYFNVDAMRITAITINRSPYYGTPFQIPGTFQAEDFDKGGEGVAYHDNTHGNQGGLYRASEDVDIISPYAGGYVVNNFETGEWMEYTINVAGSANYRIEALVSSMYSTSQFHVSIDSVDKTGLITAPNTGLWTTFQWVGKGGISLAAGQHILRLSADVQYANVDALRITQEVAPATPPDTTPPAVTLTAPVNGAIVSSNVQVTASASDDAGVAGVQFYLDGMALGSEATAVPYSIWWDTATVANALHTLTAVARDAAGNRTTSGAVQVTVSNSVPDTTAPTVGITAPINGGIVSGTVQVTASASDNIGVAGVQFYLDGTPLGSEATAVPYSISWNTTTVANASHTLTAVARDAAGNRTTSGAIQVTVSNGVPDTTSPTVAIIAPTNGATVSGTTQVTATASDNVGVVGLQLYLDGAALGAEGAAAAYSVSWDTTAAANGSHTLTAVARDAAGNRTTSSPVTVTVSNSARKRPGRH